MSENGNDDGWFNNNRLGIISFGLTILSIAYFGVIRGNDESNIVRSHEIRLDKVDTKIETLETTKVSKETFQIILNNLVDLKSDVRDVKADLRESIKK